MSVGGLNDIFSKCIKILSKGFFLNPYFYLANMHFFDTKVGSKDKITLKQEIGKNLYNLCAHVGNID